MSGKAIFSVQNIGNQPNSINFPLPYFHVWDDRTGYIGVDLSKKVNILQTDDIDQDCANCRVKFIGLFFFVIMKIHFNEQFVEAFEILFEGVDNLRSVAVEFEPSNFAVE